MKAELSSSSKFSPEVFFLFTDMVIVATVAPPALKRKHTIHLSTCRLVTIALASKKLPEIPASAYLLLVAGIEDRSFLVWSPRECFVVSAQSAKERDSWLEDFSRANEDSLDAHAELLQNIKMDPKSFMDVESTSKLCALCLKSFGIFNRKVRME